MTQKKSKFEWSEACENSFHELKNRLNTTPVLTIHEGNDGFVVYCDASQVSFGCIFMKLRKLIAYASRKLKLHEKELSDPRPIVGSGKFSFKILRHYLYGVHVDMFTNN